MQAVQKGPPPVHVHRPYILNPDITDTICISEISRARRESAYGLIVLIEGASRYTKELRELCSEYGITFRLELPMCLSHRAQEYYRDYVDVVLAKKFGTGFKEDLKKNADSLFLVHALSDTTKQWDCDKCAHLPEEEKREGDNMPTIPVSDLDLQGSPFMDFGFVVGTDSIASSFFLGHWVPENAANEQYKDELFAVAVNEMKMKYPKWIPATIHNTPIATYIRAFSFREILITYARNRQYTTH
jgi:hypothetical protein